jgi:hypothetical protein
MRSLFFALAMFVGSMAVAAQGLVIHTTEFGVAKFHRYDNKVHAYDAANAWTPYILPANADTSHALIQKNADGSFTVFYSHLDEMLSSVVQIANDQHQPVSVLNVHGHGMPGAMWFPKDQKTRDSLVCQDWVDAASGADLDNYNQYYSAVTADEVQQIRAISDQTNSHYPCTTGLREWQGAVQKNPAFKQALAPDAQIHFLSCVVGLGRAGEAFTTGIAQLLLTSGQGKVVTSTNFGLGDWSMPEGMGFWDYVTDSQLDHDNAIYPVDHKDREIMQKGTVRVSTFSNNAWTTTLVGDQSFMSLGFQQIRGPVVKEAVTLSPMAVSHAPVRIPGTNAYVQAE